MVLNTILLSETLQQQEALSGRQLLIRISLKDKFVYKKLISSAIEIILKLYFEMLFFIRSL